MVVEASEAAACCVMLKVSLATPLVSVAVAVRSEAT